MGTRGKINAIYDKSTKKLVDICEYELPTNLQKLTCYRRYVLGC